MGTKRAMSLATRVECNEEGNGFSSKSNVDKGGGQAMAIRAMETVRAMTLGMVVATRAAGKKEGNGDGGKSNCNCNKGGGASNCNEGNGDSDGSNNGDAGHGGHSSGAWRRA
jgi:hypothetical protein